MGIEMLYMESSMESSRSSLDYSCSRDSSTDSDYYIQGNSERSDSGSMDIGNNTSCQLDNTDYSKDFGYCIDHNSSHHSTLHH
jgi:hypothetical protein